MLEPSSQALLYLYHVSLISRFIFLNAVPTLMSPKFLSAGRLHLLKISLVYLLSTPQPLWMTIRHLKPSLFKIILLISTARNLLLPWAFLSHKGQFCFPTCSDQKSARSFELFLIFDHDKQHRDEHTGIKLSNALFSFSYSPQLICKRTLLTFPLYPQMDHISVTEMALCWQSLPLGLFQWPPTGLSDSFPCCSLPLTMLYSATVKGSKYKL